MELQSFSYIALYLVGGLLALAVVGFVIAPFTRPDRRRDRRGTGEHPSRRREDRPKPASAGSEV